MNIQRIGTKGVRDLLVLVATTALLYFAENLADFGIPDEAVPVVSAVALMVYRVVRELAGKAPAPPA